MPSLLRFLSVTTSLFALIAAEVPTPIHEAGRCAIRGVCKPGSFFSGPLPCSDNEKAKAPDETTRTKLIELCGSKWEDSDVCCEEAQLDTLRDNLKRAEGIIGSCPACKDNFFNLFCTFTCSPDQSLFVNVTAIDQAGGKDVVQAIDNVWSTEYQSGFYDSCKEVKVGATGGKAMAFIGGGAKNYTQFTTFLGKKQALGSPFQINFLEEPRYDGQDMSPLDLHPHACNDTDEAFRCFCVDCPAVCPDLTDVQEQTYCQVAALPCFSFAIILVYGICLLLLVAAVTGHVAYRHAKQRKSERMRLLQDAAPSDDEDEGYLVQNAGLLERPQRSYYLNQIFDRAFNRIGSFCARYPGITIGVNLLVIILLSLGWLNFEVETDPVRLWVSPDSAAAEEKAFFDTSFGPFYRTEQAFLVNDSTAEAHSPVLSQGTLKWWFDVEQQIARFKSPKHGISLDDVCFNPTGEACVVQSLSGWFQGGLTSDWEDQTRKCAEDPSITQCLPPFGDAMPPGRILGGYSSIDTITEAKALIVTWVVNNHAQGSAEEALAIEWEEELKRQMIMDYQDEARQRGLRLAFSTEISLEQELNKSTNTDAKIVAISYVVMFIYASLALGSSSISLKSLLRNPSTLLVQSKFTLGVVGIIIVLMSVSGSVGLFSAGGVKVTLIIAEVIPFLVLAVGVDNIFLIVHEFERVNVSHPDEEIDERVAKALGRMGPSILLSASTETIAFAMGAFVGMPAVKNFAVYAAGAVFINAVLQVTMFVSVLALNQRRVESLRADCIPCITVRKANSISLTGGQFFGSDDEGSLQLFIRKVFAPKLLNKKVKILIVTIFVTIFAAGLTLIPKVQLGLEERIAIPDDSYLIQYFTDLYDYFGSGPPVYFVTRDLNATQRENQQKICGRFQTCDSYSLLNVLEQERHRPSVSYITDSPASWIDNFLYWLNPAYEDCCEGDTCLGEGQWNITLSGMPQGQSFISYASQWLEAPANSDCALAGKGPFSTALLLDENSTDTPASSFRTYHTPLQSQADLINSYAAARRIADEISERQDIDVFPYSKHYIFFDQYASIVRLTATLLGAAVAVIFLITSLLLGSLLTGLAVAVTVVMIIVDILGVMAVVGVSLNAVSLVNLVICVGIGVEFCAHLARAFMFPNRSIMERARNKFRGRDARAWTALVNVGGSVFSGITITKLLGVTVLAFTRSKIFEIYYFRIWLALVIFASTHSLIFLPVLLSFMGGREGYADPGGEGGLEEDLASRRYRSLVPDDDEYDREGSDED